MITMSLIGLCLGLSHSIRAEPGHGPVPALTCAAVDTAGFHDYPLDEGGFDAVVFQPSTFQIEPNKALNKHRAAAADGASIITYLTMRTDDDYVELHCTSVRGHNATPGLSCANLPPTEMLLINLRNFRFTRTSIGGWTFSDPGDEPTGSPTNDEGESIFVEFGQCRQR